MDDFEFVLLATLLLLIKRKKERRLKAEKKLAVQRRKKSSAAASNASKKSGTPRMAFQPNSLYPDSSMDSVVNEKPSIVKTEAYDDDDEEDNSVMEAMASIKTEILVKEEPLHDWNEDSTNN